MAPLLFKLKARDGEGPTLCLQYMPSEAPTTLVDGSSTNAGVEDLFAAISRAVPAPRWELFGSLEGEWVGLSRHALRTALSKCSDGAGSLAAELAGANVEGSFLVLHYAAFAGQVSGLQTANCQLLLPTATA